MGVCFDTSTLTLLEGGRGGGGGGDGGGGWAYITQCQLRASSSSSSSSSLQCCSWTKTTVRTVIASMNVGGALGSTVGVLRGLEMLGPGGGRMVVVKCEGGGIFFQFVRNGMEWNAMRCDCMVL